MTVREFAFVMLHTFLKQNATQHRSHDAKVKKHTFSILNIILLIHLQHSGVSCSGIDCMSFILSGVTRWLIKYFWRNWTVMSPDWLVSYEYLQTFLSAASHTHHFSLTHFQTTLTHFFLRWFRKKMLIWAFGGKSILDKLKQKSQNVWFMISFLPVVVRWAEPVPDFHKQ